MTEYIIKNGFIVNGKMEKPFLGTVVVKDGKITEAAPNVEIPSDFPKNQILDAAGGYITPGFIDIHRHGDWEAFVNGDDRLLNRQGLTTVINGNCGLSVAPAGTKYGKEISQFLSSVTGEPPAGVESMADMASYMEQLKKVKRSVNTGMLAGNGTIRAEVKGYAPGPLTDQELHQVWKTLEECLNAGVLGISMGLAYAPEFEYSWEEAAQALEPLRGTQIPIATHIRNEGDGILPALEEVIRIAQKLQIPLHVSHMKCIGKKNWGETPVKILKLLDQAEQMGVKIDFDLYPYLTGSTQLVHLLPPESQKGGTQAIIRRLSDPDYRKRLTRVLKTPSMEFENIVELAGFERIYASTLHTPEYAPYAGQSIASIGEHLGKDPYDTLYDILIAEKCQVTMLDTIASEEDMLLFLKDRRANLISDAIYPAGGKRHPRVCAAFPKLLTDYVRDKKIFTIEEAIYKMTARPAQVYHMNRGLLQAGMPADICVFHLENLNAAADFDHPDQLCTGFDYVLTGGQLVVRQDEWKNPGSGKVIVR